MKREDNSFELFFKENFEKFYLYALHIVNDEETSRDIVSDAMEYVFAHYQERNNKEWFSYAVSFIRNKCIDALRRKSVHKKYAEFCTYVLDHKETMDYAEEDERLTDIRKIMDTLHPKTKLVLQECYINRKQYKEVAEELELSREGVKKHIVKALRIIREEIAKKYKKQ